MELIKTTYLTFSGKKEVIEIPSRKSSQWIIFENDIPKYYVDIYDLSIESNSMMNSLVLCGKRSIHVVLAHLNKKNNTNLSVSSISKIGIYKKLTEEKIEIELKPLPEKWLDYSM
ncbi:MAG: hypothetical protein GW772_05920 [Flavobacteriia bacterium]|nr:hypothetical protein [Flavobacteriia bacterium]OIP47715.1 MAG: hypothetical protein AUK46_04215 [Flavobacteriaceae bacterium CG2_30_31_66]PIV97405.1 MAG: hypothetical protein COW43_03185 [Flavobacteriaceae bacterium CG17_big_fil_post_rev_8_21_14_2_50_31_13]PIX13265.1 MAG: hypothetical protein COZ74_07300 [Flavobacteriaceae bacterium CG_4_8_14_3_um_filter_31_8]PIY14764.1 MAG: hypothetical protein COZ16_07425 [Flavobacteriaceae bacterium CG_4_10_14_3_um_filter_31_253]PIZ12112.1 MAG: hypotheti